VADQSSGIDLMRRRMERAARRPPPPRRAAAAEPAPAAGGGGGAETAPTPAPAAPSQAAEVQAPSARRPARPRAAAPAPERLAADLPPANLAIRVRKPLDDRLADLIHALRREGVRTSKVELIEMLLWELPEDDPAGARERLRRFRAFAPRGPGAPLQEG
jgi:hypothetical protein